MRKQITGVSTQWVGIQWQYVEGDKEVIRRVLSFLEDRRVLTQHPRRSVDDLPYIIQSVLEIRSFFTNQLETNGLSEALVFGLRSMRAASRDFLDSVGRDGHLVNDEIVLGQKVGLYQARVGQQLTPIAELTDIEVDEALREIMPPEDLDWVPGFGDAEDA